MVCFVEVGHLAVAKARIHLVPIEHVDQDRPDSRSQIYKESGAPPAAAAAASARKKEVMLCYWDPKREH